MLDNSRILIATLLATFLTLPVRSQPPGPLPSLIPPAERIRSKVQTLPIGGRLTVNMKNGEQYCGNLHSIEGETFSLREIDLKTVVSVRYMIAVLLDIGPTACARHHVPA